MMSPEFIINVNEADFEYEVLAYSQNVPVVVDFWAEWCRPCKALGTQLEALTREAHGSFRLARVNVDENPNLAMRYSVRSIPTVKAFSSGEVVSEFVGAIPEQRLREFLEKIMPPSPATLGIEKGISLLADEQWGEAEQQFRDVLDQSLDNPAALLGLARALLAQGKTHEGLGMLSSFPASKYFANAENLLPLARALNELPHHVAGEEDDENAAAYWNAVRLVSRGRIPAAIDGLLDLLRQDRHSQPTRVLLLSLFELLGDENPLTRPYRSELGSILF